MVQTWFNVPTDFEYTSDIAGTSRCAEENITQTCVIQTNKQVCSAASVPTFIRVGLRRAFVFFPVPRKEVDVLDSCFHGNGHLDDVITFTLAHLDMVASLKTKIKVQIL